MIRCEEALERLWDFLDGELDGMSESDVQEHLEVCRLCYPEYDFRRAYFELMRRIRSRETVPAGLRRSLFERILADEPWELNGNGAEGTP